MTDKLDLDRYHHAIVVMNSEEELKKWIESNDIDEKFVYKLKGNEYLLKLITDDMDVTFKKMFEQKVKNMKEYNKKNPDDLITRKTYVFYGTAKQLKDSYELLVCLQKGFGAGYSFIIGVTDGEHKRMLNQYYANCPIVKNSFI